MQEIYRAPRAALALDPRRVGAFRRPPVAPARILIGILHKTRRSTFKLTEYRPSWTPIRRDCRQIYIRLFLIATSQGLLPLCEEGGVQKQVVDDPSTNDAPDHCLHPCDCVRKRWGLVPPVSSEALEAVSESASRTMEKRQPSMYTSLTNFDRDRKPHLTATRLDRAL